MFLSTEELRYAGAFEHGKTLEHEKIKFEHEKSTSLHCREVLLKVKTYFDTKCTRH